MSYAGIKLDLLGKPVLVGSLMVLVGYDMMAGSTGQTAPNITISCSVIVPTGAFSFLYDTEWCVVFNTSQSQRVRNL